MKVVSPVVNNPEFIEIQLKSLRKYLIMPEGETFELIIFNDAKGFPDYSNNNDPRMRQIIVDECKRLGLQCINIENEKHNSPYHQSGNERCADAMNAIARYQKQNPGEYLMIDSDIFLVDYLDINRYREFSAAISVRSENEQLKYIWPIICYFNMSKMNHLDKLQNWDMITPHCDSGGMTHYWLKEQGYVPTFDEVQNTPHTIKTHIYFIKHFRTGNWDYNDLPDKLKSNRALVDFLERDPRVENNRDDKYFSELFDGVFFHYRCGSNWERRSFALHKLLIDRLRKVFE